MARFRLREERDLKRENEKRSGCVPMFTWTAGDTEEQDTPRARNWVVDQLLGKANDHHDGKVGTHATPRDDTVES